MNTSKSIAFPINQQEQVRNFSEKGDPIHNSYQNINCPKANKYYYVSDLCCYGLDIV
jgi:hypothetical protein